MAGESGSSGSSGSSNELFGLADYDRVYRKGEEPYTGGERPGFYATMSSGFIKGTRMHREWMKEVDKYPQMASPQMAPMKGDPLLKRSRMASAFGSFNWQHRLIEVKFIVRRTTPYIVLNYFDKNENKKGSINVAGAKSLPDMEGKSNLIGITDVGLLSGIGRDRFTDMSINSLDTDWAPYLAESNTEHFMVFSAESAEERTKWLKLLHLLLSRSYAMKGQYIDSPLINGSLELSDLGAEATEFDLVNDPEERSRILSERKRAEQEKILEEAAKKQAKEKHRAELLATEKIEAERAKVLEEAERKEEERIRAEAAEAVAAAAVEEATRLPEAELVAGETAGGQSQPASRRASRRLSNPVLEAALSVGEDENGDMVDMESLAENPFIIMVCACFALILVAGGLAAFALSIYFIVINEGKGGSCATTTGHAIWVYAIARLCLNSCAQCCSSVGNGDAGKDGEYGRQCAQCMHLATWIYGGIVLFDAGVCDQYKATGLYKFLVAMYFIDISSTVLGVVLLYLKYSQEIKKWEAIERRTQRLIEEEDAREAEMRLLETPSQKLQREEAEMARIREEEDMRVAMERMDKKTQEEKEQREAKEKRRAELLAIEKNRA